MDTPRWCLWRKLWSYINQRVIIFTLFSHSLSKTLLKIKYNVLYLSVSYFKKRFNSIFYE